MTPLHYFALLAITIFAIIVLAQITLLNDIITASGFSTSEVWSGMASILAVFYTMILVLTRGK